MDDIKEQGEEWIIVENFIKDKQLYIEEDSIKKAPTYMAEDAGLRSGMKEKKK